MKTPEEIAGNLVWDGAVSPVLNKQPPCEWHNQHRNAIAAAIAAERQRAETEIVRWRSAFQDCTPGGSEFMSPEAVREYMAGLKRGTAQAKLDAASARKRADALAEALRVLLLRHRDDRRQVSYRDARDAAIAALAAYDAEAK